MYAPTPLAAGDAVLVVLVVLVDDDIIRDDEMEDSAEGDAEDEAGAERVTLLV